MILRELKCSEYNPCESTWTNTYAEIFVWRRVWKHLIRWTRWEWTDTFPCSHTGTNLLFKLRFHQIVKQKHSDIFREHSWRRYFKSLFAVLFSFIISNLPLPELSASSPHPDVFIQTAPWKRGIQAQMGLCSCWTFSLLEEVPGTSKTRHPCASCTRTDASQHYEKKSFFLFPRRILLLPPSQLLQQQISLFSFITPAFPIRLH